jgi:hypothetical protein
MHGLTPSRIEGINLRMFTCTRDSANRASGDELEQVTDTDVLKK